MPSAVGYQPTLGTEMGQLQERITSTKKGSITSVQAIYVPADDITDPAPATAFAHLDATTVLDRVDLGEGHLPGRGSARLDVAHSGPARRGPGALRHRHARCSGFCSATRTCRTSSRFSAWTSCREDDKQLVVAPAVWSASLASRSSSPKRSPGTPGRYVKVEDTIKAFKMILSGELDELPEQAFYMKGGIDEVLEHAEKMKAMALDPMAAQFQLSILTPEKTVFEGNVEYVEVPGTEGYLGVLAHHAPLVTGIHAGRLTVRVGRQGRPLPGRRRLLRGVGEPGDGAGGRGQRRPCRPGG